MIPADTVILAIGDQVDSRLELPIQDHQFAMNPHPEFPVNDISYEAFNPSTNQPFPGVFIAGWARQASSGIVGIAKRDGLFAVQAMSTYLLTMSEKDPPNIDQLMSTLKEKLPDAVDAVDIVNLEKEERRLALENQIEEYKFKTNQEMLGIIRKS